ncbi:MAG: LLM class flavin-dependent oxidoreductase [Deltaproteobacteria bacterium]|nr:LLM class flavin-dependent oxidoreductase [Deltaproteobacteria bacterium]MBW2420114.1 LLM class flavin-dependent oxidoreductase [Deltaproteobacteria bacterium]
MEFTIAFDMRAPAFGAPVEDLYAAALDQCAWADSLGFDFVGIGEHHATDDGYLPSPLIFAAAAAGRTDRIRLRPSVLLAPLYDPVKLAEDLAVLQIASRGRLVVGIGAGYRPCEFAMFGKRREERRRLYEEAIEVLRQAWTGEWFEYRGRRVRVTPVPDPPPPIWLGGAHPAVARRAAHIADRFFPPQGENWDIYREECRIAGKPDPGPCPKPGPIYVHVTRDPEAAWERVTPHIEHVVRSYAEWTVEAYGRAAGPFAEGVDLAAVRASGAYQIVTPEQAVALARGLGRDAVFHLTPLLGGVDPDFAWEGLRLFEGEVWPELQDLR